MQKMRKGSTNVVEQIVCDRCGKVAERARSGFDQMLSIGFYACRDSMFGKESRVEIDLCETCLRERLGTWLRVQTPWEVGKMPPEDGTLLAGQSQTRGDQGRGRFAHLYGVLTVEEMAAHMKCTPERVREREAGGEIFAAWTSGREGPGYPAFQLDKRLSQALLKQLILEYRRWEASTTLMWSFLRSPQKVFGGLTPVEMMLGGSTPGFDALTSDEWSEAFLDVVSEELSRVTQ
jgi:hypothetical protein